MTYYYCTALSHTINNKLEELGMIDLNSLNQLTTTSKITQPSPLPQPSTNLCGKQISVSDLDTSYNHFGTHPRTSFRINELLSSKCNKHKSTIKKEVLNK